MSLKTAPAFNLKTKEEIMKLKKGDRITYEAKNRYGKLVTKKAQVERVLEISSGLSVEAWGVDGHKVLIFSNTEDPSLGNNIKLVK